MKMKQALLTAFFTALSAAVLFGADKPNSYMLSLYVGDVKISQDNGSTWNSAEAEMEIREAAVIKTGQNSYCDIFMPNRGTFRIVDNTTVYISKLRKQLEEIKVKKGKALFNITQKLKEGEVFQIQTEVAVAAVRGTQFVIESDDSKMKCSVGKGRVAIRRNVAIPADTVTEDLASAIEVDATANQELELTMDENKAIENAMQRAKNNLAELKDILSSARKDTQKKIRLMKNASRVLKELHQFENIKSGNDAGDNEDEADETSDAMNKVKERSKK